MNPMQNPKKPTPAQLAQMGQTERRNENILGTPVEMAVVNFTRIPEYLLDKAFAIPQNFTDLNHPDVKKKLEDGIDPADKKDATIADLRRQLNFLRQEEADARGYFQQKDQQAKQTEADTVQQKQEEEKQRQQAAPLESSTKQKRGQLFGKKLKKTVETAAAFGKQ